jgi:hypothetical protein
MIPPTTEHVNHRISAEVDDEVPYFNSNHDEAETKLLLHVLNVFFDM